MSSFAGLQNPWATPQVAAAAAVTSSTSPHIKAKNNDFDEAESDASPSRRVIEYQGPPPENPATSSLHSTNTVPHQPPIGLPSSSAQNTTEDSSRAALNIYGGGEEEVEDDERTSLLFGSPFADVASNNNNNNNRRPDSSSFRRRPTSSKNIRQRRALRWIHRKSGFYDDEAEGSPTSNTPAQLLGQEGNGLRFWYNDYSTIDWIHDFVKDRVRVRQLRSIKGIRGWIFNGFDGVQAWILVFLIGIICGSIASGIDIGANYLSDVRSGYCGRDWRLDKHFCCQGYYSGNYDSGVSNNTTSTIPFFNPCPDWHHYSWILPEQHSPSNDTSDGGGGGGNGNGETLLSSFTKTSNNSTSNSNNNNTDLNNYPQSSAAYWFDYFLFVLFSCLFAFVSGFLVWATGNSLEVSSTDSRPTSNLVSRTSGILPDLRISTSGSINNRRRSASPLLTELRESPSVAASNHSLIKGGVDHEEEEEDDDEEEEGEDDGNMDTGEAETRSASSDQPQQQQPSSRPVSATAEINPAKQKKKVVVEQIIRYHSAGSGIPELKTILSGFVIRGFLGIKTLIVKSIGLTLSVASGLMIGEQGPLIHISCCVGNVLSRLFSKYSKNEGKKREMLSAASAAGVSVAFAAPIGGVLFSLEEVSYYFPSKTMWRSFFCALISTVTIRLINPLGTGQLVLFQVSYSKDWHAFEFLPFLALGIFGGLYGAFFIHVSTRFAKLRSRLFEDRVILEVVLVAALTGVANWLNPFTRIGNSELVAYLFSECKHELDYQGLCMKSQYNEIISLLLVCLAIKICLTILTFGINVPAGLFLPSMVVGALVGRMTGMATQQLTELYPDHPLFTSVCERGSDCVIPGIYAMVGAAAALGGVTRMSVSLVVIMFELTGSLQYVLPIMTSIMVSKWLGDALCPDSIYDRLIALNGHPYLNHRKEFIHTKTTVDIMDAHCEVLEVGRRYTVVELEMKLRRLARRHTSGDGGFPILEDDVLAGYIAANDLEHALHLSKERKNDLYPCFFRRVNLHPLKNSKVTMVGGNRSSWAFNNQNYMGGGGGSVNSGDDSMIRNLIGGLSGGGGGGGDIWADERGGEDQVQAREPNDFTPYVDFAPLSVSQNSSMEMVVELFVKIGIKTLLIVQDGRFVGKIHKKKLLHYLEHQKTRRH